MRIKLEVRVMLREPCGEARTIFTSTKDVVRAKFDSKYRPSCESDQMTFC